MFVLPPEILGGIDILLLALLGATAEQDDESFSVLAKINPVAGAKIYALLEDTARDALGVGKVAMLHADHGCGHLGRRAGIEPVEPSRIWAAALGIDVFPDLKHTA